MIETDYCFEYLRPDTGCKLLEILHAIVAVTVSPLEFVSCNVVEVESSATSAILRAIISES